MLEEMDALFETTPPHERAFLFLPSWTTWCSYSGHIIHVPLGHTGHAITKLETAYVTRREELEVALVNADRKKAQLQLSVVNLRFDWEELAPMFASTKQAVERFWRCTRGSRSERENRAATKNAAIWKIALDFLEAKRFTQFGIEIDNVSECIEHIDSAIALVANLITKGTPVSTVSSQLNTKFLPFAESSFW
jgi:hypothetical protein